MRHQIAFKKANAVLVGSAQATTEQAATFLVELSKLGYTMNPEIAKGVNPEDYTEILKVIAREIGADRAWKPFYKGFPQSVVETPMADLVFLQILHYVTFGMFVPNDSNPMQMELDFDIDTKQTLKVLKGVNTVDDIFTKILSTNGSTTDYDKSVLDWFFTNYSANDIVKLTPNDIPFKETLAQYVAKCIELKIPVKKGVKTATDVLRVAAYMSGGDLTLQTPTKFKLKSTQKNVLAKILAVVVNEEDLARNVETWKRFFHCISKYVQKHEILTVFADKVYHKTVKSFASKIETSNSYDAIKLLKTRAGEFARRLDALLRNSTQQKSIASEFLEVADKVDNKVLWQVYNHFKTRNLSKNRVVTPVKGRPKLIEKVGEIPQHICDYVVNGLEKVLSAKYATKFANNSLGKVYIADALKKAPIPLQMRDSKNGLLQMARGTRVKNNSNYIRMFMHWFGDDMDLSVKVMTESLGNAQHVSYTNLKTEFAWHSGDFVRAPRPNGACEFIDIDLMLLKKVYKNYRYIVMLIYRFSGDCEETIAGWSEIQKPLQDATPNGRYQVYDPRNVKNCFECNPTKGYAMPVVYDLVTDEFVWVDLSNLGENLRNIENSVSQVKENLNIALNISKPSLYDLFAKCANGNIVDNIEDADTVFDESFIYKYTEVLANFL